MPMLLFLLFPKRRMSSIPKQIQTQTRSRYQCQKSKRDQINKTTTNPTKTTRNQAGLLAPDAAPVASAGELVVAEDDADVIVLLPIPVGAAEAEIELELEAELERLVNSPNAELVEEATSLIEDEGEEAATLSLELEVVTAGLLATLCGLALTELVIPIVVTGVLLALTVCTAITTLCVLSTGITVAVLNSVDGATTD